jgi:hypothetical protein
MICGSSLAELRTCHVIYCALRTFWKNLGFATSSVAHCAHPGKFSNCAFRGENVTFLHYFTFDPLDPPLNFRHCVNRYGTPDALYGIRVPLIDPTASAATVPLLVLRFFDALVQARRFTSLVISFRFQIRPSQPP